MPRKKKSGKKNGTVINEYNRDFQSGDFDVTIRSSDNVIFKVHMIHLVSASNVFRDMISVAKERHEEIRLTDERFEDASIVSNFLCYCYRKPLRAPADKDHSPYLRLLVFSNKYDCPGMVDHLEALSYKWFNENHFVPYNLLVMGYSLNRLQLGVYGLRNAQDWGWAKKSIDVSTEEIAKMRDPSGTIGSVLGSSPMDPSMLPYEYFKVMPDHWKFPLLRATMNKINNEQLGKTDWKKIAEDFEKLYKMVNGDGTS